jgi:hypothetical protein
VIPHFAVEHPRGVIFGRPSAFRRAFFVKPFRRKHGHYHAEPVCDGIAEERTDMSAGVGKVVGNDSHGDDRDRCDAQ